MGPAPSGTKDEIALKTPVKAGEELGGVERLLEWSILGA
jgi:hypothetical protein